MKKIKEIWEQYKKDKTRLLVLVWFSLFMIPIFWGLGIFDIATWTIFAVYVLVMGLCWNDAKKDLEKAKKRKEEGYNF
jgi:hypothetical protein